MESLSNLWSQIGPGMSNLQKIATLGLGGAGEIGNLINAHKQAAAINLSPQALASRVAAATQPLSQGLQQSVGNVVQANLAERGLSEAPGIYGATLAQALAPYYQQNQQLAADLIGQQYGYQAAYNPQSNLSNLLMTLALGGNTGSGGWSPQWSAGAGVPTFPNTNYPTPVPPTLTLPQTQPDSGLGSWQ